MMCGTRLKINHWALLNCNLVIELEPVLWLQEWQEEICILIWVSIVVVVYRSVQDIKTLEALVKNNLGQDTVRCKCGICSGNVCNPCFSRLSQILVGISCLPLPGDVSLSLGAKCCSRWKTWLCPNRSLPTQLSGCLSADEIVGLILKKETDEYLLFFL